MPTGEPADACGPPPVACTPALHIMCTRTRSCLPQSSRLVRAASNAACHPLYPRRAAREPPSEPPSEPPRRPSQAAPNVIFHNLGHDGLSRLFGTRIAAALHAEERAEEPHGGAAGAASVEASRLVSLFRMAFREFSYIVTEYKPTHGTVFAEYLRGYSHW